MACLSELAKENMAEAKAGICWFVLWRENGKIWKIERFDAKTDQQTKLFKVKKEDYARMREILKEDYEAKFINGIIDNLGPIEHMTIQSLTNGLKRQYKSGRLLCDCI